MKAIRKNHTTHVLGAPKGWDEEKHGPCEGLPVSEYEGVYYSYWVPTWWEWLRVLVGWPVRLCVACNWHPAVALDTED